MVGERVVGERHKKERLVEDTKKGSARSAGGRGWHGGGVAQQGGWRRERRWGTGSLRRWQEPSPSRMLAAAPALLSSSINSTHPPAGAPSGSA